MPNYNVQYVNGTLTVLKDRITAVADDKSKIYGTANPKLTVTYSGFVKGEDISVIDIPPVPSTSALQEVMLGTYPITLSAGSDDNYDIILVNGNLEIQKAELTVTAENSTRVYGTENPSVLNDSYSGFVSGQNQSVIDILPVAQTDAEPIQMSETMILKFQEEMIIITVLIISQVLLQLQKLIRKLLLTKFHQTSELHSNIS